MTDRSQIEMSKIVNGNKITQQGSVINSVVIGGGVEPKNRLTVEIERNGVIKVLNLVEKTPSQLGYWRDHEKPLSEEFFARWKMLKDAKLPVPDTVRITSDTTIVMTDLTADGSDIYGKTDAEAIEFEEFLPEKSHRKPRKMDYILNTISTEVIKAEALKIATRATESDISLPFDDPLSLIIHPDGSWQLMILDLGDAKKGINPDPDLKPTLDEQNKWLVEKFMTNIQLLKDKLGRQ